MKDYLSFIASDDMEGRDTPSRGLDMTAHFSRRTFRAGDLNLQATTAVFSEDRPEPRRIDSDGDAGAAQQPNADIRRGLHSVWRGRPTSPATDSCLPATAGLLSRKTSMPIKESMRKERSRLSLVAQWDCPQDQPCRSDRQARRRLDERQRVCAEARAWRGWCIVPDFQYLANWDRNRTRHDRARRAEGRKVSTSRRRRKYRRSSSPAVANRSVSGREDRGLRASSKQSMAGKLPEPFELSPEQEASISIKVKSDAAPRKTWLRCLKAAIRF